MIRLWAVILALVTPVVAMAFDLVLPLDCRLGDTCYIQQFFDHDSGPDASDFTCGTLSYDGHDGTDFAVPTLADQAAGVAVLAAAPGVVAGTRDGMVDGLQDGPNAPDITDRECGNGVLIRHPDGWETQYCHMRQGSILVAEGQEVAAGAPLGQVGLSGDTQFPHMHLSVRYHGVNVDPFDPDRAITCGAPSSETLWADPPAYAPGGVIAAGFATAVPQYDAVKAGTATEIIGHDAPAMVMWGLLFGGQAGDLVDIVVTGPTGEPVTHRETLDRTQAQLFRAAGKRRPPEGWPLGDYVGRVSLTRDGSLIDSMETRITIGP